MPGTRFRSYQGVFYQWMPGAGFRFDFTRSVSRSVRIGPAFEMDARYLPGWAFYSLPGADLVLLAGKNQSFFEFTAGPRAYLSWGHTIAPAVTVNGGYRLESLSSKFLMRIGGGIDFYFKSVQPNIYLAFGGHARK